MGKKEPAHYTLSEARKANFHLLISGVYRVHFFNIFSYFFVYVSIKPLQCVRVSRRASSTTSSSGPCGSRCSARCSSARHSVRAPNCQTSCDTTCTLIYLFFVCALWPDKKNMSGLYRMYCSFLCVIHAYKTLVRKLGQKNTELTE